MRRGREPEEPVEAITGGGLLQDAVAVLQAPRQVALLVCAGLPISKLGSRLCEALALCEQLRKVGAELGARAELLHDLQGRDGKQWRHLASSKHAVQQSLELIAQEELPKNSR